MSQESLAHAAKVHPTYISLLERGLRDPRLTSIQKVAKALGTSAGVLVEEAEGAARPAHGS
jgi:transcriptional regulator with XRE-family HTH domain